MTSITAKITTSEDTSTDNLRARANGAAGRDRRRDAADRDPRGERRRPFAAEAEALTG